MLTIKEKAQEISSIDGYSVRNYRFDYIIIYKGIIVAYWFNTIECNQVWILRSFLFKSEMFLCLADGTKTTRIKSIRVVEKEIEVLKYCCVGRENMSVDLRTANFSYCPHCGKKIK